MKYKILLFLILCSTIVNSQEWQSLTYSPDQDSLEFNPLKGLTPLYNVNNDFPHSIRGSIIGLDAVMFGLNEEDFNWSIFDQMLDEQGAEGRFGYLQVNVDMGFNRSDLPAFLSNVERYYYDGMDPEDGAKVPSVVVNYNNEEFMTALLRFIEIFGKKYNNDPRVFLVHYGLYGIFGEWDLGFGKRFVPEEWAMTPENQKRITDAYALAFSNKNLLARFPENVPESQAVGYSDGLYFGGSVSDDPNFGWFFHPKLKKYNADLNWKNYPIGGEVDPDVQPILWTNFPNTVVGLPGQVQETETIFELTRPTFLFQDFVFNGITRSSNPTMWDNALKATKRTGYTFHINEVRLSANNSNPAVEVNIQNKGLAPMYADWEVEFGYIDDTGSIISLGKDNSWNLKSIQPEVDNNYRSFISSESIPDGTHTFLLRIINPLETISDQARPVRFANTTQDADASGWLTLGQATISSGSLGNVPTQVTGITTTPSSTTMGLDNQLQLSAVVSPSTATNAAITWSSNRPRTAAVDENGLVTTFNLSGEVEITASTQDGAFESTTIISVQPFWVLPRRVEAEGFSDIFNAQVNPAPSGEDGGSVLGFIGNDTWMEYTVQVSEQSEFVVDFRAASPFAEGIINILNDAGSIIGTVALTPGTANYDTYSTYTSSPFVLPEGLYTLRLDVVASSFNLNWIEFRIPEECEIPIGSSCDDANPDTVNDVYTDNCECIGTSSSTYTPIPGLIEAEAYFDVFNAQANPVPAGETGGEILGFIGDDTWMEYGIQVTEEAEFLLDIRAASPFGVGVIDLLNSAGETVTTINLTPATTGYDSYGTYSSDRFTLPVGSYIVRLDVVASAFNLNWLEFRFAPGCENPIGTACDDGDATTTGDVYTANCDCVGIPVSAFTDIPSLIEAEDFYDVFNVQVNPTPAGEEGGSILGFIADDTWMDYAVTVTQEAEFVVDFRAASPFGVSIIDIVNQAGETISTIALTPATADYDTYGTYTSEPFTLPAGSHILRLDVVASAFNLNWIEFRLSATCENPIGTSCDDGDPTTTNDVYTSDCECLGIPVSAFTDIPSLIEAEDYYNVFNAQVNATPAGEEGGSILGFIADDTWMDYAVTVAEEAEFVLDLRAASPFGVSIIDIVNQAGETITTIALTPATADYDTYGTYTSEPFTLPAGNYVVRLDVVASAFNLNWIEFRLANGCSDFSQDTDLDGICDTDDTCPSLDNSLIGTPCDDQNACTINDVYTTTCDCEGTFQDSDNDAICDAEDLCPDFDDALIGTACDDLNPQTTDDIYTSACNCEGTLIPSPITFMLIDAELDIAISTLNDGDVINLNEDGWDINIEATLDFTAGSVRFELNNKRNYRTESQLPYALAGDRQGNFKNWTPDPGNYELTAIAYSQPKGKGDILETKTISFEVVYGLNGAEDITFQLINADTDVAIGNISDGAIIDLAVEGSELNIVAELSFPAGSVRFGLDNKPNYSVENKAPYSLAGNNNGNFKSWTPSVGSHQLQARAYSGKGGSKNLMAEATINFEVINTASATTAVTRSTKANTKADALTVSPNPFSDELTLELSTSKGLPGTIHITDLVGRTVYVKTLSDNTDHFLKVNTVDFQSGLYFLNYKSGDTLITKKIIKP